MTTENTPSLTPAADLEVSGHHWPESAIAETLHLDAIAMSRMVLLNLPELLAHGPLPVAAEVYLPEQNGGSLVLQHAFNARQLLTLLLMGRTAVSQALRSAALSGFRDLSPEALKEHFLAMGGTMPEPSTRPTPA